MTPSEPAYIQVRLRHDVNFLIDVEDYIKIKNLHFYGYPAQNGNIYVSVGIPVLLENGFKAHKQTHIARVIKGLSLDDPREVDHINGNTLDNRKINLRVCSHRENTANRCLGRNNTTGFKGVTQVGPDRWAASIGSEGRVYYLGAFDSPEKAHVAYCEAAAWLHGEFANFGEDRSGDFKLSIPIPEAMPVTIAVPARRRRTLRARVGMGRWGSNNPRPIVANNAML